VRDPGSVYEVHGEVGRVPRSGTGGRA
jgi:hypothetical protein